MALLALFKTAGRGDAEADKKLAENLGIASPIPVGMGIDSMQYSGVGSEITSLTSSQVLAAANAISYCGHKWRETNPDWKSDLTWGSTDLTQPGVCFYIRA